MSLITNNLNKIFEKIQNKNVSLVTVTKTRSIDEIKEAINSGAKTIAENRVQEAAEKYARLRDFLKEKGTEFHLIGSLQTNKVKKAVEFADLIQSVDSLRLAKDINKRAGNINKIQNILIQVNIGDESQKSGCRFEETIELIKEISKLKNIEIQGLMCITPYFEDPEKTRPYFRKMKKLFDKTNLTYLSMGMTHDYEIAIEEGSNMVRIGTGIFGDRKY
ncbi:YggS family pyridoxal phosphate-dependent enzyme [Candidatus Woesearchaeota archaeon]|nr:YggS family pyridoxal phosphate-dependent enzyme [Candidatus Woesearchaeota archaeon]